MKIAYFLGATLLLAFGISDIQFRPRKVRADKPAMESMMPCPAHICRQPSRNLCPVTAGHLEAREGIRWYEKTYMLRMETIRMRGIVHLVRTLPCHGTARSNGREPEGTRGNEAVPEVLIVIRVQTFKTRGRSSAG